MIGNGLYDHAERLMNEGHWRDVAPVEAMAFPNMGQPTKRVAVIGLPDTGKRALCNTLWGWQVFTDKDKAEPNHDFGLFSIHDLDTDPAQAETLIFQLGSADLILYLIDGRQELRTEDFRWIARIRAMETSLVLALTHVAEVETINERVNEVNGKLPAVVLPLDVTDVDVVHNKLIPAMIKAAPALEVPLAKELQNIRKQVASRIIIQNVVGSAMVSLQPVPGVDVGALLVQQSNMVERIAQIYGQKAELNQRQEVILSAGMGLALRYVSQTLAKAVPIMGWLVSGAIGASATWAVGQAAMRHYNGETLPPPHQWWAQIYAWARDAFSS